jgi:hypothetical protein
MAVTVEIKQTGSTSAQLHAQPGDVITIALASTGENAELANAIANLTELGNVGGVSFVADLTGDAV